MDESSARVGLERGLEMVESLLDAALAEPGLELLDDRRLLALVHRCLRVSGRVEAATRLVVAEAEKRESAQRECGVSTAVWLRETNAVTLRQAHGLIKDALRLARLPRVASALGAGEVSVRQVDAITAALRHLPDDLSPQQQALAEVEMVARAGEHDPGELRRLGNHLVEVVDPDHADALLSLRLERQEKIARQNRELRFLPDGHGTTHLRGRLPTTDAAHLEAVLDAIAEQRSSEDAPDKPGETGCGASCPGPSCGLCGGRPSRAMLRADALTTFATLTTLAVLAADAGGVPPMGGDRPRVTVTVPYETLRSGLGAVEVDGQPVSAREARLLACDAEILPAVLDRHGVPLDVGRARRLFTGELRAALVARDQGCVFPGCERPPRACEAHHVIPWWHGGPTSLGNGVLLCRHHHALVEPARERLDNPHRWQARIDDHGLPEFLPPAGLDPGRRPRRHHRHRRRRGASRSSEDDDPG